MRNCTTDVCIYNIIFWCFCRNIKIYFCASFWCFLSAYKHSLSAIFEMTHFLRLLIVPSIMNRNIYILCGSTYYCRCVQLALATCDASNDCGVGGSLWWVILAIHERHLTTAVVDYEAKWWSSRHLCRSLLALCKGGASSDFVQMQMMDGGWKLFTDDGFLFLEYLFGWCSDCQDSPPWAIVEVSIQ